MTHTKTLTCEKEDAVAICEIPGGIETCDALAIFSGELQSFFEKISADEEVRVIVITGGNGYFLSTGETVIESFANSPLFPSIKHSSVASPTSNIEQPVIAAIDGDAIGQGLELALACDIRIATERACFGFPHIKKGVIPWDGGTQRLSRIAGKAKAMEMILTGDSIDAKEALRIGLVSQLVKPEELRQTALEMAKKMAAKGPIALRYAKEAINKGLDLTLYQGLHLEADLYFLLHTTEDRKEGINAFREKRTPDFKGR